MSPAKEIYKVGITGSYGGMNLGDEAILQSIITQLRKDLPVELTVFSRDAEDTKRRHGVERAIPVRKLSRAEVQPEIERLDLLVFGGGGILYDAEEHGVPVMLYAVGAGPLSDPNVQLREEAGVRREVVVTAEPALLLKPEPLPRNILKIEGLEGKRKLIGMSADFMVDRFDADIVFVPMERSVLDSQHSRAVIARMLRAAGSGVILCQL